MFFIAFIVIFLLFNLRQDSLSVVAHRIKNLQADLLVEYYEQKGEMDMRIWKLGLLQRREEIRSEMKRGLKVRKGNKLDIALNAFIDKTYDDLLTVISADDYEAQNAAVAAPAAAEPVAAETRAYSVEEMNQSVKNKGARPLGAQPPESAPEDLEELEDMDELEELEEAEPLFTAGESAESLAELPENESGYAASTTSYRKSAIAPAAADSIYKSGPAAPAAADSFYKSGPAAPVLSLMREPPDTSAFEKATLEINTPRAKLYKGKPPPLAVPVLETEEERRLRESLAQVRNNPAEFDPFSSEFAEFGFKFGSGEFTHAGSSAKVDEVAEWDPLTGEGISFSDAAQAKIDDLSLDDGVLDNLSREEEDAFVTHGIRNARKNIEYVLNDSIAERTSLFAKKHFHGSEISEPAVLFAEIPSRSATAAAVIKEKNGVSYIDKDVTSQIDSRDVDIDRNLKKLVDSILHT
jgi:hypothetical protein